MTDPQFTALTQALPAIITACGVLFIGVLSALTRRRDEKADEKQDKQSKVIDEIHTVTNSNLSAITAQLKQSTAELAALKERLISMDKAKDVADNVASDLAAKAKPASTAPEKVVVVNTPAQPVPIEPAARKKP